MWVIRHQAKQPGHLHRHPLQGRLMLIWFNSLGQTCAHTILHPIAAVCNADVNLSGSADVHMLDFRGFSAPCYEAYSGPSTYKRKGGPTALQWKRIWHDGQLCLRESNTVDDCLQRQIAKKSLQIENRSSSCQGWSLHAFETWHFICD